VGVPQRDAGTSNSAIEKDRKHFHVISLLPRLPSVKSLEEWGRFIGKVHPSVPCCGRSALCSPLLQPLPCQRY